MVHRHLNFNESLPLVVDPSDDDEEEEDFPTAPLDDLVWSEEPIPARHVCIYRALRKPEASFPFQIPTQSQYPVYESATLEELMESMFGYMQDLIDIPKEVLFQNYLYA